MKEHDREGQRKWLFCWFLLYPRSWFHLGLSIHIQVSKLMQVIELVFKTRTYVNNVVIGVSEKCIETLTDLCNVAESFAPL